MTSSFHYILTKARNQAYRRAWEQVWLGVWKQVDDCTWAPVEQQVYWQVRELIRRSR